MSVPVEVSAGERAGVAHVPLPVEQVPLVQKGCALTALRSGVTGNGLERGLSRKAIASTR